MKPTAILTGDIHLRDDQPVCRTDEYFAAQHRKIKWLRELQEKHDCPVFDAGDLFSRSKPSHFLLQWAIQELPERFHTIPGNHDLPSHNLELLDKSGLGVLRAAGAATVHLEPWHEAGVADVYPFPWGMEPVPAPRRRSSECRIAICHIMTYQGDSPWPGCQDPDALSLLKRLTGYDLVLTGHNHKPFVVEHERRLLVNPGSLMRSTSDQADHKPRVYLWYADDNHVEPVFVPIEEGVVSREHIEVVENRDERIDAFVSRLSGDWEVSLSFERNLEEFFGKNRVRQGVKDLVWESVRGEK
jgi:predicted phosphodiesterase